MLCGFHLKFFNKDSIVLPFYVYLQQPPFTREDITVNTILSSHKYKKIIVSEIR